MIVFLIAILVVVVGLVVAVIVGRVGTDSMSAPTRTASFSLPPGPVGSGGIETVRFDQALRGYNMAQVDQVLDRLFDEIADLEDQLAAASRWREPETTSAQSPRGGDIVQFRNRHGERARASEMDAPQADSVEPTQPLDNETPSIADDRHTEATTDADDRN